jgi:hypothetical protein
MKGVEQIEHTIHDLTHPKRPFTFWGLLAVLALATILIWGKHSEWLGAPNNFMLGESPDGFKNYMTSAWHVAHDSSYTHYGGMGYPFGEHVLFTDNQPIVSAAMQWWSENVSDLNGRTVGVMNLFEAISLLLGAGVIFLLLRKLHLPVWYAGLSALAILFLSPQYNRIDGHFGLSHIWVFPLILLLLCRYEERHSRRYQSLQIGVVVWFAAQLHFYFFGISALFLGLYTLVQLALNPSLRNFRVRFSHLVVMVLLPFVLLNIWIHWSDYATDRPANPYGFTSYIGYWEGVFLPYEYFPFYKWIDQNIVGIRRINTESQAYIGIAATIFTVWLVFFRRFRLFEKDWSQTAYHRVHERYLRGIFITAFVLLIFSCGFPFAIPGLEWIADYFGPFRQFRGLGRFTWAYYYVINVLLFYVLWNISVRFKGFAPKKSSDDSKSSDESDPKSEIHNPQSFKYPWFRWAIALVPLALLIYEAFVLQKNRQIALGPNLAQRSVAAAQFPWLDKVDFSQFQALMPLPYYHVGSENIWLDIDGSHFRRVQSTALHTGVPDLGVFMSRTSIGNTLKSVQFAFDPCAPPELLEELPDNRPFALLIHPPRWEELQKNSPHLTSQATLVFDHPELKIMSLVPDSVRTYSRRQASAIATEIDNNSSFSAGKGWVSSSNPGWFASQTFDSLTTTKHIFQGKGAYLGEMGDTTWLWKTRIPKGHYNLSLWTYAKQDMGMTHEVKIIQNSRADGHEINFRHEGLRFYLKTIVDDWALYEIEFTVHDDDSNVRIFLQKRGVQAPFYLDEVLIKPLNSTLYRRAPGWAVRNNFWYKLPEK